MNSEKYYKNKYLKYKAKYLNLKQLGSSLGSRSVIFLSEEDFLLQAKKSYQPIKRLTKEIIEIKNHGFLLNNYTINSNTKEISFNAYNNGFTFTVIIANWPFNPPLIKFINAHFILDTLNFIDKYIQHEYYSKYNPGTKIISFLNPYYELLSKKLIFDIPTYNVSPLSLGLIVGANYTEDRKGRTFHDNPNVFLLDLDEKLKDFERYINVDFNDIEKFKQIAETNKEKFTTICFDWSVWKFFVYMHIPSINYNFDEESIKNAAQKINCFYKMLKPNGVLIIPEVQPPIIFYPPGTIMESLSEDEKNTIREDFEKSYHILICKLLIASNFKFKIMQNHEINNELLNIGPLLHSSNKSSNDKVSLVAMK